MAAFPQAEPGAPAPASARRGQPIHARTSNPGGIIAAAGADGRPPFLELAGATAAALLLALLLAWRTTPLTADLPGFAYPADHHKYIEMAREGPGRFHVAPFCRRVGAPAIVHALFRGDMTTGFRLLSLAGVVLAGIATYGASRAVGLPTSAAVAAMAAYFSMGWASRQVLHDFWLPDGPAHGLMALSVYLLARGRFAAFAAALAAGAFFKEVVLLAAPVAFSMTWGNTQGGPDGNAREHSPAPARDLAGPWARWAAVAPAILVLIALFALIPARNDDPAYMTSLPARLSTVDQDVDTTGGWARVRAVMQRRLSQLDAAHLHALATEPFTTPAVAFALLGLGVRRHRRMLLGLAPMVILAYAQLTMATDTQRLLAAAWLPVAIAAAAGMHACAERLGIDPRGTILLPAAVMTLNLLNPDRITSPVLHQVIAAACTLLAIWAASRMRRRRA